MSPTLIYATVGFVIGALLGLFLAHSPGAADILIGALMGLLIGVILGVARYHLWDRR